MFTKEYWIPSHVHVCATTDGSVLLDLKRDRYYGLGASETEVLRNWVRGWPAPSRPGLESYRCAAAMEDGRALEANALCQALLCEGLLTRETVVRGQAIEVDMRCDFVSIADELEVKCRIRVGHVANFMFAYAWAWCHLHCRSFYSAVAAARSIKENAQERALSQDVFQIAALIDAFRSLRPFVFTAERHCLLHALTLVKFLSRYQCHPEWVIGVATQPWSAHSWVQWGRFLLDTNPEKVCRHTPIMVV
jgi:hypothetical protein